MNFHHDHFITLSISPKPSFITLPRQDQPLPLLLDFFDQRFPRIGREVWLERLRSGKISDEKGRLLDESTPYRINARLRYYREVKNEPIIPFQESIVYEDEHILVADKPHFLPVTPNGNAVNECLMHRLVKRTGNHQLVPVHRLDRETAGLVLFSKVPETRKHYHAIFQQGNIKKQYEAVATLPENNERLEWLIESRIEASGEWTLHHNVPGEVNARSHIKLLARGDVLARFALSPLTGKTHQLRLHMGLIGSQIQHDTFYPHLLPQSEVINYAKPLQLLAKQLVFTDPVSSVKHQFESTLELSSWSSILNA
ncbi:pseudouridine synthase [Mariprofundus sp. EBB-1]|uniref:pseudouridine synthase n=1 Tax=Mariprofundus sp. EBB-1 TaxID=2650971 RepID=UPI000EF213DD|nr:pseudouridine synthase [Mariprofundus sp. EBB-1]RLL55985.1 pseudouridine synthase [Mariprofundus sp. EBB-1]